MKRMLLVIVLVACKQPPSTGDAAATTSDPPTTCTKLGATCTIAPGKLGSCVEVEQVSGASAFTCQSQH
jgi:hypothetical protein